MSDVDSFSAISAKKAPVLTDIGIVWMFGCTEDGTLTDRSACQEQGVFQSF